MITSYFTFGQCHFHNINGQVFDKDTVLKITADNPRAVMFQVFGVEWAMQYDNQPDMTLFPKGLREFTMPA